VRARSLHILLPVYVRVRVKETEVCVYVKERGFVCVGVCAQPLVVCVCVCVCCYKEMVYVRDL